MGLKLFYLIFILLFVFVKSVFANSIMEIFSDSNFSTLTTDFSPGQAIYIKIESEDPGEKERIVKLKDNQYKDISNFTLIREGGRPYIYKVSFAAPSTSGIYSIEATIASAGSQNKLVKTIQVGSQGSSNTRVNVRTKVEGTKTQTPKSTTKPTTSPTFSPTPSPTPAAQEELPAPSEIEKPKSTQSFWESFVNFLKNIFKFFIRF